jgi:hypothetical protein
VHDVAGEHAAASAGLELEGDVAGSVPGGRDRGQTGHDLAAVAERLDAPRERCEDGVRIGAARIAAARGPVGPFGGRDEVAGVSEREPPLPCVVAADLADVVGMEVRQHDDVDGGGLDVELAQRVEQPAPEQVA